MAGRRRGEAEALIRLLGEDKITALIERAQAGVFGIGEATKEASQETDGLLDGWKGSVVVFNQGLELVGKIGDGVKATFEIIKDAAAADAVNKAFADQFQGAEAAVEKLRKAVAGALSDQELKRVATQFQRAGLGIDKTSQVLNVAARISATTGQALSEVTEELQDAIIGASDSNLEKFGIIADLPELAQKYAKEQGIAKDEIDKSVESAAILEEILGNVSDKFADADLTNLTTQVGQLEAQWQNLNDGAAQFFKTIAVGAAQDLGILPEAAKDPTTQVRELLEASKGFRQELKRLADGEQEAQIQLLLMIEAQEKLSDLVEKDRTAYLALREEIRKLVDQRAEQIDQAYSETEAQEFRIRMSARIIEQLGLERAVITQYGNTWVSIGQNVQTTWQQVFTSIVNTGKKIAKETELLTDEVLKKAPKPKKPKRPRRPRQPKPPTAAEIGAGLFSPGVAGPAGLGLAEGFSGDGLIFDVQGFTGPPDPQDFMQAGPPDAMIEQILKARDAVNGLSDSFAALGMTFEHTLIEGMRQSTNILASEVDRISSIFKQTEAAGDSTGKALAASVPGAVKAGGDIAKALGASMVVTETLYGIADVAQAATRFAFGDVKSGAMFTVSAGLHFAAAAQAGAKGGGGRGGGGARTVPRAPSAAIGQPAAGGGGGPMQITQVFSGVMIGPGGVRESARAVKQLTEQEATRGARSADFIPAG